MELTIQDMLEQTRKLAQPVDFEDLEKRGVISKAGAWYRVHNLKSLPKHAQLKIYEMAQDSKGIKVKFTKASRFEKVLRQFEQLAAASKKIDKQVGG